VKTIVIFFLLTLSAFSGIGAQTSEPLFTWNLLWTGFWYKSLIFPEGELPPPNEFFAGGTLYNRGNLRLGLPRADTSLRFLATDKRLLPLEEDDGRAGFHPALGIYHHGSGSRILYGVQNDFGLPARINNIWLRSVPFMESRSPSSRDLKIEPAARDSADTYIYLSLPHNLLPGFDAFVSAAFIGEDMDPAFGTGMGIQRNGMGLRVEGFYTEKELAARKPSSWFSSSPPLPERDFEIYALNLIFYSPFVLLAADGAFSETFAWGRGAYGNFSLRLGNRPWRFSFAGDAASSRFVDRSGSAAGAGLRVSAKGELFQPRSGLLRLQSTLRSPGLEEDFNRGNISLYYRPSAPTAAVRRENPNLIRMSRASLYLNRDARNPEKTADTLNALVGYHFGPFSTVFSGSLNSLSRLTGDEAILFQTPIFENFESLRVSAELGWRPNIFDLRFRLGHTFRAEKDPIWDFSVNCSVRPGRWGRVGLRIASTDFPEKWNYTLSWRFEHNGKF